MGERRRWMTYGALALAAVLVLWWGVNNMGGRAAPSRREEPRVVVVDPDSGRRQEMPLEEYVKGVVAGEMKENWPKEAYAAQAILARTFALQYMEENETNEIPAEHESAQAYAPENITPAIEEAVEMTRGKVMTYEGRPVRAWFHAYSGGITATAKEGLAFEGEEPPYIASVRVPDNDIVDPELKNWEFVLSPEEVRSRLEEKDIDVGAIQEVEVVEKGPTGRITRVRIRGSNGETTMTGPDFRLAMGAFEMKSTLVDEFEFDPDEGLTVKGTGFGHGVGLSQWDAHMFARQGRSPEEIVNFFFRDIQIHQMWQ